MARQTPVEVVQAWQEAANRQEVDHLLSLSDENIKIHGPRGVAQGHHILRDWLNRAGLVLTTQRTFARENTVVAEQHGVWRSSETGAVSGEAEVASRFVVENSRVTEYARYDTLAEALQAAGLTEGDELSS